MIPKNRRVAAYLAALLAALLAGATPAAATSLHTRPVGPASTTWRGHVQNVGNQSSGFYIDIVNERSAASFMLGTTGRSLRLEEVSVGAMTLPQNLRGQTMNLDCFQIQGHVSNVGWQRKGRVAGTRGLGLGLEAIRVWSTCTNVSVQYRAHVRNVGWQGWKTSGQTAGTTGQSLPIEALEVIVRLPDLSKYRDAYDEADRKACKLFGGC